MSFGHRAPADSSTVPAALVATFPRRLPPTHLVGEWQLFTDWCTATGHPALPTTAAAVHAFVDQLPAPSAVLARRVRAIRAVHQAADAADPVPLLPAPITPVGERYRGDAWADPDDVLAQLAQVGHPAGVAARRDAVIVLLCLVLGKTRREALTARAGVWPVPRLDGADLGFAPDPARCHACALTRWLRIQAADRAGGRWLVEDTMNTHDGYDHDCRREVPPGWMYRSLLPAVDTHGWISRHASIRSRALSEVIRRRLAAPQEIAFSPSTTFLGSGSEPLRRGRRDDATLKELDELLDLLEAGLERRNRGLGL